MTDHLTPDLLNSLADGELSADQLAGVNEHLAQCPSCTSGALAQSLLKSATARAGQRYAPPRQFQQRLMHLARQQNATQETSNPARRLINPLSLSGWATACVLLLAFASVAIFERQAHQSAIVSSESAALITEACDQHIATLAANEPPQVISTDRHTVKPWFQGKLPFSFNLPDNLPVDTKLEGANLTYLHNQPAALLLYSIGKHRVSVFVLQRTVTSPARALTAEHAGFHVAAFSTSDLDVFAVSDVDTIRLSNLVSQIQRAQAGSNPQST
jgi:anti-sigma factor RsiW